jgi:predicted CopG family antitoxin
MKTIQISDEAYAFLKDLAGKLNTQDNRMTANPRYYAIREKDNIYGMEEGYADDYIYVDEDGEMECDTVEEAFGYILECNDIDLLEGESFSSAIRREWGDKWSSRSFTRPMVSVSDEEILVELFKWGKVRVRHTEKFSNCFLTEEAAKQHIRINGHNLRSPDIFLFHAYRNEELDMVIKAIKEIGNSMDDSGDDSDDSNDDYNDSSTEEEYRWGVFSRTRKDMIAEHCFVDEQGNAVAGEDGMVMFKSTIDKDIFLRKHDDAVAEYRKR